MTTYEKQCNGMYLEKYSSKGNLLRTAEQFDSGNWVISDYPDSRLELQGEYTSEEFNEVHKHF